MKNLPSAHQHGDAVNLNLFDAGRIHNCKVTKVSFDPGKVFYDVEVKVKPGMSTRLRMIDSSFVEKVIYSIALRFASNRSIAHNLKYFKVGEEYTIFDCNQNPEALIGKITYKGFNHRNLALIFDSIYDLQGKEYDIRFSEVSEDGKSGSCTSLSFDLIEQAKDRPIIQPDEEGQPYTIGEPMPVKTPMSEYDMDRIKRFSILDIDKIFDDERRNHGTNPIDSINRMYRKLLALKERGE